MHLNISSISCHYNDLSSFKIKNNSSFRVQNKKNKPPLSNIDLINYFHGQTPTDVSKVVTLLYISEELNYKICKDLQVYKPKELESTFIKIITKNRKNLIVGCVRNILLLITKIIDLYILPLLEKLSCETKQVMLMGDFNIIFSIIILTRQLPNL